MKSKLPLIGAFALGAVVSVSGWEFFQQISRTRLSGADFSLGMDEYVFPEDDFPLLKWGGLAFLDTKSAVTLARDVVVEKIPGIDPLALRPERAVAVFVVNDREVTGLRVTFTDVDNIEDSPPESDVKVLSDEPYVPGVNIGQYIVTISPDNPEVGSVVTPRTEFVPNARAEEVRAHLRSNKSLQPTPRSGVAER